MDHQPHDTTEHKMTVVLCSYNGGSGVDRCLSALAAQTVAGALEIVVVDDASTDGTSRVAAAHDARCIRHPVNRGLSAARNTGIRAATAPIIAFVDDDCIPRPDWAEQILGVYDNEPAIGVGGTIDPIVPDDIIGRYLRRQNPLSPVGHSRGGGLRQWFGLRPARARIAEPPPMGPRAVWALVGANMSWRRDALFAVCGFDPRFTIAADEMDLAHRIHLAYPEARVLLQPSAIVAHEFNSRITDNLRRARGYGRGAARMFLKSRLTVPRIFIRPAVLGLLLAAGLRHPRVWFAALVTPVAMMPASIDLAIQDREPTLLLDGYFKTAQQISEVVGFAAGLSQEWRLDWDRPPAPLDASKALDGRA